jgi:hypothetical protein
MIIVGTDGSSCVSYYSSYTIDAPKESRRVAGVDLCRHRQLLGNLLVNTDPGRNEDAAHLRWARRAFCLHQRAFSDRQVSIELTIARNRQGLGGFKTAIAALKPPKP